MSPLSEKVGDTGTSVPTQIAAMDLKGSVQIYEESTTELHELSVSDSVSVCKSY